MVIVDAIEIPIQRPKKQKKNYSGKKKPHTFKIQAIIHYQTLKILSLCRSRGAVHDFELFKRNLNQIPAGAFILVDKGYHTTRIQFYKKQKNQTYKSLKMLKHKVKLDLSEN